MIHKTHKDTHKNQGYYQRKRKTHCYQLKAELDNCLENHIPEPKENL